MLDSRTTSCGLEQQLLVPVVGVARLVQQQLGGRAGPARTAACAPTRAARRRPRRSRCRRSRRSRGRRGTRTPCRTISCSSPRASRSLAQTAAVGRRAAGIPTICSPASRPPATVSVCGDRTVRASSSPERLAHGEGHALEPLLHLGQAGVAADEGDPPVAALEQVVGGQPATEDVVDGDRALVGGGRAAVDEDHRHAAVAQRRRARGRAPAVGVISTPWTRVLGRARRGARPPWPAGRRSCTGSRPGPRRSPTSSTPRATSVKNGLAMSSTTRPIVRLRPARRWRADSLRTNPSVAIESSTRCRVVSLTDARAGSGRC